MQSQQKLKLDRIGGKVREGQLPEMSDFEVISFLDIIIKRIGTTDICDEETALYFYKALIVASSSLKERIDIKMLDSTEKHMLQELFVTTERELRYFFREVPDDH